MKRAALSLLCTLCLPAAAQEALSGYHYLGDETRAMQDDDFANPAMLWLDYGRATWNGPDGANGSSCASCHGTPDSMRGVSIRYPRVDSANEELINLEGRINRCRTEQMKLSALPYESEALIALTTLVAYQSRGMAMNIDIDGSTRPFWDEGERFFHQRRGQLDLSCAQCHDLNAGKRLRGDVISQGQINGFPVYRLTWQDLGSTHRMFAWCNDAVRAEPYALGSREYLSLELYVASRGRGLEVESPAVRR